MSHQNTAVKSRISSPHPLPAGWRWVKLGEVCKQDRQIVEPNTVDANSLTYYGLEHIESETGQILKAPIEKVEDAGKSTTFRFNDRHVLYGKLRPYLNKVALPVTTGRCTTEIIPLICSNKIDHVFLAWVLRRRETVEFAMRGKTGSRMPRANMDSLLTLQIPLPPLLEQRRIAGALREQMTAVDKARAAALARLAAVKALPAAFLRQVFPQPGQPLPDGWRWVRLGEVCGIKGGKRLPNGTDFVSNCTPFPYIRVVDFKDGTVDTLNLRYLDKATQSAIYRYTIGRDDVYISIAGSIGIVGTIPDCLDGANLTENAAKLVICDKDDISRDYLGYFLMSSIGQGSISERTNTVGQPKLALTRIATIPIPLPPLPEQQRIAGVLRKQVVAVGKVRASSEAELNTINTLPSALLRRAFTGEL
jgi:type I restriction enzyme S subunit